MIGPEPNGVPAIAPAVLKFIRVPEALLAKTKPPEKVLAVLTVIKPPLLGLFKMTCVLRVPPSEINALIVTAPLVTVRASTKPAGVPAVVAEEAATLLLLLVMKFVAALAKARKHEFQTRFTTSALFFDPNPMQLHNAIETFASRALLGT